MTTKPMLYSFVTIAHLGYIPVFPAKHRPFLIQGLHVVDEARESQMVNDSKGTCNVVHYPQPKFGQPPKLAANS